MLIGRRSLALGTGLAGLLAMASFLRLETIASRPLWFDERFTFRFCAQAGSLTGAWGAALMDGWEHPPLHYTVTYLVMALSRTPAALRLPSAVAGVLTVLLVVLVGRRLLGLRDGLVAGLLLGLSIYHVNYSMDARPYALLVALVTAEVHLLRLYLDTGRRWLLAPLAAVAVAALYTHHLALVAQGIPAVLVLAESLRARRHPAPGEEAPVKARFRPGPLLLVGALVGLAYLPQAPNLLSYLTTEKLEQQHLLRLSWPLAWHLPARWGVGDNRANLLVLTAFTAGILRILLRRRQAALLLAWLAVPFLPFVLIPFGKFFDIRFLMVGLPAFILITAAGLVGIGAGAAGLLCRAVRLRRRRRAVALATIALLTLVLAAQSLGAYRVFRWTRYRCSEFYLQPDILERDDGFCREHIILNTLDPAYEFLLRPAGPDS